MPMPLSPQGIVARSGACFVLAASLAAIGCGPSTGAVTGKVIFQDTALKGGNVVFVASDGKPYLSAIAEDGTYTVEKVTPGDAKITVETKTVLQAANAPSYKPPTAEHGPPPGAYGPPDPETMRKRYVAIPDKYEDPQTSGLTYTVKPGSQHYDIPLK